MRYDGPDPPMPELDEFARGGPDPRPISRQHWKFPRGLFARRKLDRGLVVVARVAMSSAGNDTGAEWKHKTIAKRLHVSTSTSQRHVKRAERTYTWFDVERRRATPSLSHPNRYRVPWLAKDEGEGECGFIYAELLADPRFLSATPMQKAVLLACHDPAILGTRTIAVAWAKLSERMGVAVSTLREAMYHWHQVGLVKLVRRFGRRFSGRVVREPEGHAGEPQLPNEIELRTSPDLIRAAQGELARKDRERWFHVLTPSQKRRLRVEALAGDLRSLLSGKWTETNHWMRLQHVTRTEGIRAGALYARDVINGFFKHFEANWRYTYKPGSDTPTRNERPKISRRVRHLEAAVQQLMEQGLDPPG